MNIKSSVSILSLMAAIAATPAVAQEMASADTVGVGDIIVTANKREENLRDVPISIKAFTAAEIEKSAIREISDYATRTANVGFDTDGSPSDNTIFIRGVGNLGGNVQSNVTYIDEIAVTPAVITGLSGNGLDANDPNITDIERIEVLRGPQGVSFGRSALGGAVSIVTAKPTQELMGKVDAEYGRFDTGLLRGTVNVPLSETVMVRANAYYTFSGGYLRNFGDSDDSNAYDGYGGSLAVRLLPTEATTVDLRVQHRDFHQELDSGVPTGVLNPTLRSLGFPEAIDDGQGFYPANRRGVATDAETDTWLKSTLWSGRIEQDFGPVSAIFLAGYLDGQVRFRGDGDLTNLDFTLDRNNVDYTSLSLEGRLQSNADGPFDYVVGVNYNRDKSRSAFIRTFGGDFFGGFFQGDNVIDETASARVRSVAVFADLRLRLLEDRLTLSAGGRYSWDRFRGRYDEVEYLFPGFDNFTAIRGNSSKAFTPRFNAIYEISPTFNVYGTISRGYKPAGASLLTLAINPETGQPFDAQYGKETLWNYEVGLKGDVFDRMLSFNLSLFYMKWNDIQVGLGFASPVDVDDDGIADFFDVAGATQNAASATSKGLELDVTLRPTESFTLSGAVGYNNAKYKSFPNAVFENPEDGVPTVIDASGNRLPLAPKWTATVVAELRPDLGGGIQPFVRGEWIYKGKQFLDVSNIEVVTYVLPSYDYANLLAGVEWSRYTVSVFVNNLTDSNYISGYNGSQFFSGARAAVNPRTFGLRISAKFGE